MNYVLGVDEAGRGPLAGPVAVGFVLVPEGFDIPAAFPGVNDSKQLSEKERERLFEMLEDRAGEAGAAIRYCVRFGSHAAIDRAGIAPTIRGAVARGVRALAPSPAGVRVLLDGSLRAPAEYRQETIIKGDATVPAISLASIVAKVMRDRLMKRLAKTYPAYGFDIHKGYGTKAHYAALAEHGPCVLHRRTFLHFVERGNVV